MQFCKLENFMCEGQIPYYHPDLQFGYLVQFVLVLPIFFRERKNQLSGLKLQVESYKFDKNWNWNEFSNTFGAKV